MKRFTIQICLCFALILMPLNTYAQIDLKGKTSQKSPTFLKINKPTGFSLPIDCTLGTDCWTMNYVDIGPNDNKQTDPACFSRTYDTHKGTDIALLDNQAMQNGVDVIAPMDGTVKKVRDGQPDQWSTPAQIEEIKAKRVECGNAVIIDHADDYQTIYCHMKEDSVVVKPNQKIKRGDKIGEVGMSGLTEFPHIHFGILKNKKVIDPFTGQTNQGTCGKRIKSLWNKEIDLQYQPFIIQSVGFKNDIPVLEKLERDNKSAETISVNTNKLTFWAIILGAEKGDDIDLTITDPNGKIFAQNKIIQDKTRARQFYYIGKNTENTTLIEGAYIGSVTIKRKAKNGTDIVKDKISTTLIIN